MDGYAVGQGEFVCVLFADHGLIKVAQRMPDAQLLFLTGVFPTGYQAAEQYDILEGDSGAIVGVGPVWPLAICSASLHGAEQVVAIDCFPDHLEVAVEHGPKPLDYTDNNIVEALKDLTGGRGPDSCIYAVGLEAHATGVVGVVNRAKQVVRMETGRPHALPQAIQACRKGGTVSIPGVYGGFIESMNIGGEFINGLTFILGQAHIQNYLEPLLEQIDNGRIDPSFAITHQMALDEAQSGYKTFQEKQDVCIKVVLRP